MPRLDPDELQLLEDYESGQLISVATKAELQRLRDAARATAVKDKRVNIRLSYQTLIASVLHKYVSGQLTEKKPA